MSAFHRRARFVSKGTEALLHTRLPEFDDRALIEAMGLREGGRVLWERAAPQTSNG